MEKLEGGDGKEGGKEQGYMSTMHGSLDVNDLVAVAMEELHVTGPNRHD